MRIFLLATFMVLCTVTLYADKTVYLLLPSLANAKFDIELNGANVGDLKLPVKSTQTSNSYKVPLTFREAAVLPIDVKGNGEMNILAKIIYTNPVDGSVSVISDEQTVDCGRNGEMFFELKSRGIFHGGTKLKELVWKKGDKKLKSGKYHQLRHTRVNAKGKFVASAKMAAKRKKDKEKEEQERKARRNKTWSDIGNALSSVSKSLSDAADALNGGSGETSADEACSYDTTDSSDGKKKKKRMSIYEYKKIKKEYDKTIDDIKNFYRAKYWGRQYQKAVAEGAKYDSNLSTRCDEITHQGNKNKIYLQKIAKLREKAVKLRKKAKEGGYTIPKSKWETHVPKDREVAY